MTTGDETREGARSYAWAHRRARAAKETGLQFRIPDNEKKVGRGIRHVLIAPLKLQIPRSLRELVMTTRSSLRPEGQPTLHFAQGRVGWVRELPWHVHCNEGNLGMYCAVKFKSGRKSVISVDWNQRGKPYWLWYSTF